MSPLLVSRIWIMVLNIVIGSKASALIGYGSSTAVVSQKIQEGFLSGFELGLQDVLGATRAKSILLTHQVTDNSSSGAITSANILIQKGAQVLVGFPGSHDSLLVARLAQEKKIPALFVGSGHSDLANFGSEVLTTGIHMKDSLLPVLRFAKKKYRNSQGYVIINPFSVFSKNQQQQIQKMISDGIFKPDDFRFVMLNKSVSLSETDIKEMKEKSDSFIVLTPYPEELVKVMSQIENLISPRPIFAGSSWATAETDIIRRYVLNLKAPFFMATEWLKGSPDSIPFEKKYRKTYGTEASPESSFGFDVGSIVGQIVLRIKGPITSESFRVALNKDRCFKKLSVSQICFQASGGHALRDTAILQFTKDGMIPVSNGH
jgi:ABC-type branched-subunit amino acid transport system substrate-binding protein